MNEDENDNFEEDINVTKKNGGDSVGNIADEMLRNEESSLQERVQDLERQVSEQRDEITCLKSTLSDVLRRLTLVDGSNQKSVPVTPSYSHNKPGSMIPSKKGYPSIPISRSTISPTRNPITRTNLVKHSSSGSLHSDTPPSSTSGHSTPAPSPLPNQLMKLQNSNNSGLSKRWLSTGDFVVSPSMQNNKINRSLLNLNNSKGSANPQKHGSNTIQVHSKEDSPIIKMYLRGRPIVFNIPESLSDNYESSKVLPAPNKRLKLDWVYGYRGKDCRSNLYQLPTGEMIYFVAAVVILYNMDEQSQRHYLGHTDDVRSLAIHPNKLVVASGQCSGTDRKDALSHIRVWNTVSLATLNVIGHGEFHGAITCLSFNLADGGALLTAIDDAPDKMISIWDWQRMRKLTETKCSVDTIVAAEFHPLERNQIVTIGKNHISFWTLDQTNTLYKKMGIFENREKPKYVTCLSFTQAGDVITGDSNGNIIVWARGTNTISRLLKKIHDGPIFSLCPLRNGGFVSGGGKDSRLVLMNEELNMNRKIEKQIELHFGTIRVISQGKGNQLLIGTTRNCILAGDFDIDFVPVVMGHTEELWGLATHPNLPQFITAGMDRLLQFWDSLSHSVVWSKDIGEQIQCCTFSIRGEVVLVGGMNGRWMVFDTMSREMLAQYTDGPEIIQTIKFSPDGSLLAVGSRDNYIYIYETKKSMYRFNRLGKCTGHSSFILHLDWSTDSQILRSNSGDYETLYWNPMLCRQITNSAQMGDVKWASQSCTLSFETIGIWPENADGTDINTVAKSPEFDLLVTGDDFGKVKLFSYPACQPKCLSHSYGGHSSHVTNVSFLQGGTTRLLSTGGADTSVMQWIIT